MAIEYRIALHDEGWIIQREGQRYGPYSSKQEAVREAVYVANYSISRGLQAEVIVQSRLMTALRTIAQPVAGTF